MQNLPVVTNIYGKTVEYRAWKFPDGCIGVKIEESHAVNEAQYFYIRFPLICDMDTLMIVRQLCDALTRLRDVAAVQLFIPFFPYARQDRACHRGEANSLELFISMLPKVRSVLVHDVHSKETIRLLEKYGHTVYHIEQHELFANFIDRNYLYELVWDFVVSPDQGALAKTNNVADALLGQPAVVRMEKTRNGIGVIEQKLIDSIPSYSRKALIVDDICDGGATFISAAKVIKEAAPGVSLDLYVTHGLFSKGVDELLKFYDTVSCYHLMNPAVANQVRFVKGN